MYIDIDGYIPVKSYDEKGIDAGSENFGFKDQKGRECGFRWRIVHYTCIPLTQAEWEAKGRCGSIRKADKPLTFFELTTSPCATATATALPSTRWKPPRWKRPAPSLPNAQPTPANVTPRNLPRSTDNSARLTPVSVGRTSFSSQPRNHHMTKSNLSITIDALGALKAQIAALETKKKN